MYNVEEVAKFTSQCLHDDDGNIQVRERRDRFLFDWKCKRKGRIEDGKE